MDVTINLRKQLLDFQKNSPCKSRNLDFECCVNAILSKNPVIKYFIKLIYNMHIYFPVLNYQQLTQENK